MVKWLVLVGCVVVVAAFLQLYFGFGGEQIPVQFAPMGSLLPSSP
jgi:hypothetical protein